MTKAITREQWLNDATDALRPLFKNEGYNPPKEIKVSCGFAHRSSKAIGQCWPPERSESKFHEILISPVISDAARVLDILAHEMAHATVGCEHGHKAPFAKCAKAIGLTGKMTATIAGEKFTDSIGPILDKLPKYPHAELNAAKLGKKQSTRLLKGECRACGYTIRVTKKWAEVGEPICPCGEMIEVEIQ